MAFPWLDILDTVIALADIARIATGGRGHDEPAPERKVPPDVRTPAASLDMQLAAIVSALRDAAVRDSRRLDAERDQRAAERLRAERTLRLELVRHAGGREIGRMRTLAGVAVAAWVGTLVWSPHLSGSGGVGARALLGFGWLFLLGAIAASFLAQSRVAAAVDALANGGDGRDGAIRSGASGAVALWFTIGGLVLTGLAALIV